jgi:hypothetical protein
LLAICFAPSLADSFILLTLTRLVVVFIFVNFSFALFTPPLGDYQYPDYERLDRGAEGQKRKRVANVLDKEAAKLVKKDEETLKTRKLSPKPKIAASKKKKATALKRKTTETEDEAPSTPPAIDVEEILKVMTESLPVKISPLGPHLTKLFQKEKEPSTAKKPDEPKNEELFM